MKNCETCGKEIKSKYKKDNKWITLDSSRKICAECKPPVNKAGIIKKKQTELLQLGLMWCSKCNKTKKIEEFYDRRKHQWCKRCVHIQTRDRQNTFKQSCLQYKGGKCEKCGYNKCDEALDFHHIDSSTKKFEISKVKFTNLEKNRERIIEELDKCILVCSNCHREIHAEKSRQEFEERYPSLDN